MSGLMREQLVKWRLNGETQPVILCSPGETEAMLTGLLLTSQRVCSAEGIGQVTQTDGEWRVTAPSAEKSRDLAQRLAAITPCASAKRVTLRDAAALCDRLMALDHKAGLHTVMLSDGTSDLIARDIGRHNALDKAVGMLARTKRDATDMALCTSGRINIEILAKSAAVGIPVLCTCKQVGDLAASMAEQWQMTIIQVGKQSVSVYGAAWRATPV